MGNDRFWMMLRLQAMPALVSVAAIAVALAAVVFIVDTIRGDDEPPSLSGTIDRELGELVERFGLDDFSEFELGDLGLFSDLLPPELAEALSGGPVLGVTVEETSDGLVVEAVAPGSPADDAGIEPGDIIERVDGEPVDTVAELREALDAVEPGDDYRVTTERDGRRDTLELQRPEFGVADLSELLGLLLVTPVFTESDVQPAIPAPRPVPGVPRVDAAGPPMLGVQTVETDAGVRVTAVLPGFGAAAAGIEPGDWIVSINGERIVSAAQLRALLSQAVPGDVVQVEIDRDGNRERVVVELSPGPGIQGEFRFTTPSGGQSFGFGGSDLPSAEELRQLLEELPPDLRFRLAQLLEQLIAGGALEAQPSGGPS